MLDNPSGPCALGWVELAIQLAADALTRVSLYAANQLHSVKSLLEPGHGKHTWMSAVALSALLAAPACALDKGRSLDHYTYQTWQTGSGLPQNTLHAMLQGRDGYMWLATQGGLVRFDGFHFVVFDKATEPVLGSNNIESLAEDQDGALWVGTANSLCRYTAGLFTKPAGQDLQNILALRTGKAGGVWAVLPDEVAHLRQSASGVEKQEYKLDRASSRFTGAIAPDASGSIWVGTQTGLKRLRAGHLSEVSIGLPPASVDALSTDRLSNLWIGTAKGLYRWDLRNPAYPAVRVPYGGGAVLSLMEDWEGTTWVGTEDGLIRFEPGALREARAQQTQRVFAGTAVISLSEDSERNLWIGTESHGLTIVRDPKFVTYTTRDGLTGDAVRCVFQSSGGSLWIGTNAGLTQWQNGHFTRWTAKEGLLSNVILSLNEDAGGSLLIGTPDGLNRMKEGKFTAVTSADGLADDFIRSIFRDSDNTLWLGSRRGLSHQQGDGKIVTYTQRNGLGSDLVGSILRDRRNDLWIGTLGGLTQYSNGRFRNFTTRDGLSSNIITALFEDGSGDLWIGTQDGGLNLRRGSRFLHFPKTIRLPRVIDGIAEDGRGELWLSSSSGIVRVNPQELKKAAESHSGRATVVWYGTSDGLQINECSAGGHPSIWKAQDGTLWFATLKGVAALSPRAGELNHVLPPVAIEAVAIDSRTFAPDSVKTITPGHSRFAFEYAGISFAAPEKVVYRYRLEGFDKDWIDAGTRRTAFYTNIPPGAYSFRVTARNNDGFWNSTGASLAFQLEPHFYQTIWFDLLAIVGTGLLGYLIYRWRVADVQSKFDAVLGERNRIAREIHDTLAQGFIGVSVQLELVSRLLASSAEAARGPLDQARLLVRESISEARQSIWQLRSQASGNGDLASRLSNAATLAIGARPVKLTLEVHGTYRPLQARTEDELLRIGQEAVSNALRHAEPTQIQISMTFARKLRLVIADDGRGFTPGEFSGGPDGHFGLKGMRERASQIGGRLILNSQEGKGTKVIVEAPLH